MYTQSSSLKLSLFELQLSNSDFEDRFKFVRESSSKWRMNHWNLTKIDQTGANYGFVLWKQCIQSCPQKTVSSLYLFILTIRRNENCPIILKFCSKPKSHCCSLIGIVFKVHNQNIRKSFFVHTIFYLCLQSRKTKLRFVNCLTNMNMFSNSGSLTEALTATF